MLNGPRGKHTVSPESVFEGLPRSLGAHKPTEGILCGTETECAAKKSNPENKEERKWAQVDEVNRIL